MCCKTIVMLYSLCILRQQNNTWSRPGAEHIHKLCILRQQNTTWSQPHLPQAGLLLSQLSWKQRLYRHLHHRTIIHTNTLNRNTSCYPKQWTLSAFTSFILTPDVSLLDFCTGDIWKRGGPEKRFWQIHLHHLPPARSSYCDNYLLKSLTKLSFS